ncbi:unnamed protein product [Schistosoma rodhaini]|uniref:Protein kinase domain-containing protein n=1 Tax=Schistosoma rodhaini TaxID=6188 RepID=A0AA85EIX4_9TREM|nr:unnamed protein product [Schistosoma rodhaini]
MFLRLLFGSVRLKHLWMLVLAYVISFVVVDHHSFSLIPVWALHLKANRHAPIESDGNSNSLFSTIIDYSSYNWSIYLSIAIPQSNGSSSYDLVVFQLPMLKSLELSVMDPYRKITNFLSFQKIRSNSFNREPIRLKSFFYKESLIHVVVECRKISSRVNSYVLFEIAVYDSQLNEMWRRALHQILLDEVDVNFKSVPISLSFDLTCGLVYPRLCGVIFVGFPTNNISVSHYSTISLSLEDGKILWHHLVGDFEDSRKAYESDLVLKNWKIRISKQYLFSTHIDESPWTEFTESLSHIFPVRWYGVGSCEIRLVYAKKHSEYLVENSLRTPNAIAVIHPSGLDLLDLKSGHPLMTITLKWKIGSTYTILSTPVSDGLISRQLGSPTIYELRIASEITDSPSNGLKIKVPPISDHVNSSLESDFSHTVDCQGIFIRHESAPNNWEIVKSFHSNEMIEIHSSTYHGLCRPFRMWEYSRLGRSNWQEDSRKSTPPVVVKRHIPLSGLARLWYSLMHDKSDEFNYHDVNQDLTHKNDHEHHDIYFLTSDGIITSVSNHGYENWRVSSEVSWLQVSRTLGTLASHGEERSVDKHLNDLYIDHFRPSLTAINLASLGQGFFHDLSLFSKIKPTIPTIPLLVSTGWDSIGVVDRTNGQLLAAHRLPTQPTGQPIVISLALSNITKLSEVVNVPTILLVPCNDILVGFALVQSLRIWLLVPLIISLTVSFFALTWCCDLDATNS